MKTEWTVGAHHVQLVQPDILLFEVGGPALLEEMKELMRIMDGEVHPEVGDFFFFLKLNDPLPPVSPEVRKFFASTQPPYWKAFVTIGGSTLLRTVMSVSGRTVKLLRRNSFDIQVLETYEQACAYAERARAATSGRQAGP